MSGLAVLAQALSEGNTGWLAEKQQQRMASALAMIADVSHSLDLCRRRAFKSSIKEECKDEYPVEVMLFSQDLGEKLKAVGYINRVSKSLSKDNGL